MREVLARLFADGDGDKVSDEPQPGDVAVHPQSPSYHEPGELDNDGRVKYISKGAARATLGLAPCAHCQFTDADGLEVDLA